MKTRKEERQPLLTASQSEPVNDVYDRTPIPRPGNHHCINHHMRNRYSFLMFLPFTDLRNSPDNVVVHLPGAMEGSGTPEAKTFNDNDGDGYNPLLNRTLEHPTS